jgi:hypothetical protein
MLITLTRSCLVTSAEGLYGLEMENPFIKYKKAFSSCSYSMSITETASRATPKRVYHLEDKEDIRIIYSTIWRHAGYQYIGTENPEELFNYLHIHAQDPNAYFVTDNSISPVRPSNRLAEPRKVAAEVFRRAYELGALERVLALTNSPSEVHAVLRDEPFYTLCKQRIQLKPSELRDVRSALEQLAK